VLENMSMPNLDIESRVRYLSLHTDAMSQTEEEFEIDIGLARTAADIAIERHAGTIEVVYTPGGPFSFQFGKDLTGVRNIIGTGGIIAYGRKPERTLEALLYREQNPLSLRPKKPVLYIDEKHIMYAMGLMAEISPVKALRIMKRNLHKL